MNQWYSINRVKQVAFVRIGDELGFFGPDVEDFASELGDAPEVQLVLDSNGGSIRAGFALYALLRTRRTVCTVLRAHSSAALIAMAAPKGSISIAPGGSYMLHAPRIAAFATAPGLRSEAEKLEALVPEIVRVLTERTGKPQALVEQWLAPDADTWFDARAAVSAGLADAVLPEQRSGPQRRSTSETVPTPGAAPEPMNDQERFALDALSAIEPIQTTDRARFMRNLYMIIAQKVR